MAAIGVFEMGSGPIWMNDVQCEGHETSLANCSFTGYGVHNCDHEKDAGVMCDMWCIKEGELEFCLKKWCHCQIYTNSWDESFEDWSSYFTRTFVKYLLKNFVVCYLFLDFFSVAMGIILYITVLVAKRLVQWNKTVHNNAVALQILLCYVTFKSETFNTRG